MLEDPSLMFVAKALKVAELGIRRRAAPTSRAGLLKQVAIIRQRIHAGHDRTLAALGCSGAGIAYYYETEFGLGIDEAKLLADATIQIIEMTKN